MTQNALESIRGALVQNLPTPPGIDAGRWLLWNQRGKFSYEQIRGILGAAIQSMNEEMVLVWGDMITLTTESGFYYMNGGAVTPAEVTMGKSRPSLVKGFNAGHTIDLKVWALGIGGDGRTFEDMTESQLIGSVVGLVTALRDQFDHDVLSRAMTNTETLLGEDGYDVGFCDGSPAAGSGGPSYAPPKWNGQTFYEDHNHYIGVNASTATYDAGISQLAGKIAEHGILNGTDFKVYVSETDVTAIRALATYVMPVDNINYDRGGLTTGNIFFENGAVNPSVPQSGGRYIGSINTGYGIGRLYATPRIPTEYAFLYRPGSPFAANNAIGVRYRPSTGFGVKIVEIPDFNTTFPIKEIDVENEYGVSCGTNRFAGAAMYWHAGVSSYTNPTIAL